MEGRTALIAAIVSGALAVAVVTVDLQFGLDAELQAMEDGEWVTVADSKEPYFYREPGLGCAGQDLRLYVDNDRVRTSTVDVSITYYTRGGENVVVLDDTWVVGPGDVRFYAFTVPDSAFEASEENGTASRPVGATVNVNAFVDGTYLSACITQEDSA